MGKINLGSVVLGGLVAGVVLNIVDYLVFAVVLKLPVTSGQLIWFVILDFVYGIGLVWVYAAVRPRFNPGPRTAVIAGVAVWFFVGLLHALGEAPMALMPQKVYVTATVVGLVQYPLATALGAYFYKEV
ncbi:MAG: hypothetical protein DMD65_01945 [Gemmatimonadetes bacterium]|nr:MAG: hypothetical protein DMD65_01945 [Gemmatimonadota bacterium]